MSYYCIDIRGIGIGLCINTYSLLLYIFVIIVIEKVTQSVSNSIERTKLKSYTLASSSLV